jgi:hypothetical protein
MRWISHHRKLYELLGELKERLSIVAYEELCRCPVTCLRTVADRLGISAEFDIPKVDHGALVRGANMAPDDVAAVKRLLILSGVEERWLEPLW